jgi:hypothetical protein
MRAQEYLGRLIRSSGNDILDGMAQRFGFLDFDLPARLDELLLDPYLDLGMAFRPRHARPQRDLGLYIFISALTIE